MAAQVLTATSPGTHPGKDYYVFPATGSIQAQSNPILAEGLKSSGWAGPFDWAHAKATASNTAANPANDIRSATAPIAGIAKVVSGLMSGNFWLRVGEVIAGLILLGIGVNALFKGKPLDAVTKVAGAVPKVVPV